LVLGLPADKGGDHSGCYQVLACVARLALAALAPGERKSQRLNLALYHCREHTIPAQQAWLMRIAFEEVLGTPPADHLDCLPDPGDNSLRLFRAVLQVAIQIGDLASQTGDANGCWEVYACTARLLLAQVSGAYAAKRLLCKAQQQCMNTPDVSDRAWFLRTAFDEALRGKPSGALAGMQAHLSAAIDLGVEASHAGNDRGCYELYACVARLIVDSVAGAGQVKDDLQAALDECDDLEDSARVKRLRDVFDAILSKSA
jgi:hypothetical protein